MSRGLRSRIGNLEPHPVRESAKIDVSRLCNTRPNGQWEQ